MSAADRSLQGPFVGTHAELAGGAAEDPRAGPAPPSRLLIVPVGAVAGNSFSPKRSPGRPAGSRNIRTEATAVALIAEYGDPLEADVAIGTMPLGELVTELRAIASDRGLKLGMTIGDIVRWQRDCRGQALPYLHARRAPTAADGSPVTPIVAIGRVDHLTVAEGGRSIEDMIDAETVVDQGLIEEATDVSHAKSHAEKSHDVSSD